MARPGLGKLQALQNDEARIITRIHELEHILSSPSTSIVQQSKAKVELSQLQRQVKQVQCTKRQSMRNLGGAGIVTKNRAVLNSEEERLKREEEIRMLHLQLQSEGVVATQQQIEEKIKIAKMELDALDNNVEEGERDDGDAQDVSDVEVDEEDDMSDIEEEVKEEDSSDEEGVIDEETKAEDTNNETRTKATSLLKLQSLQQKSLRIISRTHELESILADTTVSTVKRTQAKVELAQLQRKEKRVQYTKRLSMTNLGGAGIVTKNRALLNAKDEERRRHEEEIRMLHLQLQNRGDASNNNKTDDDDEEVRKIEEQLKVAQMALEELDKEEEEEEQLDEKKDDEYVTPVTTKLDHNGASDGKQQENENLPVESANNDASTPTTATKQPPTLGRRASVQNVNTAAIVSKNRALLNAQHEGRLRHEEEIQRLQLELQTASEEQRRRLEELLKAAQKALETLDDVEEGTYDDENREKNPAAISEDQSVSMKMNHVGTQTDDNPQVEEGEEEVDTYPTIMARVSSDNYSKRSSVRVRCKTSFRHG